MGRQFLRRCFRQRPDRIGNNNSREKDRHLCQERGGRAHDELAPTYNLDSDGCHDPDILDDSSHPDDYRKKDLYRHAGIHYCFEKGPTTPRGRPASCPVGRPSL